VVTTLQDEYRNLDGVISNPRRLKRDADPGAPLSRITFRLTDGMTSQAI
jgi:hypothetical protein